MTDLPTDITLEPVWLIEATYAPDAAETRTPFRARHLARLGQLKEAGIVIEAGAFVDVSSSMMMVRAADEAAALDIARGDIYMANGVWVELRARPFARVVTSGSGASGS
jgi:uncharacterized protein YciI